MYKLVLCLRYLRTRYIALASIISVMLGVATMIVVNLLGRPELLIFPGTYAVLSFIPVSIWTLAMRRRIIGSDATPYDRVT